MIQGCLGTSQVSSQTWSCPPCSPGFSHEGYTNKGAVESSSMLKESHCEKECGDPERPLHKAIKMKTELCWRTQDVRCPRTMGYLPKRVAHRKWN